MNEVDEDKMKVTDITADKFDNALEAKSKVVQLGYEGRAKEKAAAEAAEAAKKATNE